MITTMKEAAESALAVQNACNLSGVVTSFVQCTGVLWEEARKRGKGTGWVNTHPISILYANQISHLTGGFYTFSAIGGSLGGSFQSCELLAKGDEVEHE